MDKLREECGVFGIFSKERSALANDVYYALFALQHRGQSSCGIVVNDDGVFNSYCDNGLVGDVFTTERLSSLGEGNAAVGHVRYGAEAGSASRSNAQPLVVDHVKGRLAIAHNGSLINYAELREELELEGKIFQSDGDAEVIAYEIIRQRLTSKSIEEAVSRAMDRLKGAYSLVVMSPSKIVVARDKHGFRPLCYGTTERGDFVAASESCALDAVGATLVGDVEPGEILVFDRNGCRSIRDHCGEVKKSLCVFEFVYFARPDSVVDGSAVHIARQRAGAFLALEHPVNADVVIGVPDSGIDAAIGYARQSGIPYGVGLLKNKYIGRTFIAPVQKVREDKVRIKLNPIASTVAGKRVILIDDSIVRGTTSARIVKLLREAGATEIHMRISSPPFLNPCYYGTDIASRDVLIAHNYSIEEIAKIIGVDSLGYLSIENVKKIADRCNKDDFCTACFDNIYPTEEPSGRSRNRYDRKLSEKEGN